MAGNIPEVPGVWSLPYDLQLQESVQYHAALFITCFAQVKVSPNEAPEAQTELQHKSCQPGGEELRALP